MEELQSCNICGSQETTIIDGLMYCVVCSTQITNFRELEADDDVAVTSRSRIRTKKVREELDKSAKEIDYVAMGLETPMARKRRKGDFISSKQTNQKEIFTPAYEALRNDGCPGREHAPFYLRNIGSRLTSFTTMLAKCVSTLRLEADFPDGFPNHCFAVFQRYLAVCGVAFVDYEYTEDVEQMFRTLILNKNLDFEKKCAKRNRKILRKTRGTEKLGKSVNAWDLLVGDTLDENLEMSSESEGEIEERGETLSAKSPKLVTVVDTKISKSCLNNAGSIYLDMDALVAILYISSVTFGCKWVLLSDIIRWMREDRFCISKYQRSSSHRGNQADFHQTGNERARNIVSNFDMPLYEFFRTSLFIWQLCNLPSLKVKADFEQIAARILYHLNLPKSMMERILALKSIAPPALSQDSDEIRKQGRIEEGRFKAGLYFKNAKQAEKFQGAGILTAFGRPKHFSNEWNNDVFFTLETKVLAYVLLALKLMFGLDDVREFKMKSQHLLESRNETFCVITWIYQLQMRMMMWEGYDPKDILQQNKPVHPLFYNRPFGHGENSILRSCFTLSNRRHDTNFYYIRRLVRERGFNACIPHMAVAENGCSLPNPFPEDTCDRKTQRNNEDAIYAPLRHQSVVLHSYLDRPLRPEEKTELQITMDREAVHLFKTNFEEHELSFESAPNTERVGYRARVKTKDRCSSEVEKQKWTELFPCAKGYVRLPRPLWSQGGLMGMKDSDDRLRRFNSRFGIQRSASGPRVLFASRKGAIDALNAARPGMSRSFELLLEMFAKIIGDSDYILYAAFMMLEFQVIGRQNFLDLGQKLVNGNTVPMNYLVVKPDGSTSMHTVRISPLNKIESPDQLEEIRFGLPKDWGSSIWDDPESDDDYESDSETSNHSYDRSDVDAETSDNEMTHEFALTGSDQKSMDLGYRNNESSSDNDIPLNVETKPNTRIQRHFDTRAYDFDMIWQLITMRYW